MPEQSTIHTSHRLDITLLLLLFLGGIILRLALIAPTGFDGLYGQDPYAYYAFAGELRSAITDGHALSPFFWPLGYPALLAITGAIFGTAPQVGQLLNILLGAALAPLIYVLARQMNAGRFAALTAGLLVAICGQAVQSSLVIMADIPALFWATVSSVILWRYISHFETGQPDRLSLPLAAFTLSLAIITRWIYTALILPWGLVILLVWKGRIRWRDTLLPILLAALVLIPQLAYSRTTPYPILNHAWVEGWSPANALRQTFDNVDGHFEYPMTNAAYYAQPFYDGYYLAPIFTPFLLIGLLGLFIKRQLTEITLLVGWGLLPYLFLIGIPYQNIRFPLMVFPAVAITTGFGLETARNRLSPRFSRRVVSAAWVVVAAVGLSSMWTTGRNTVNIFIGNQQRDKETATWTAGRVPEGATLYTFGLTLTLRHYTVFNVYDLYFETPETLADKWTRGRDDYLLLNVWNIENQWDGRDPQLDFHWLRDTRGLVRLGKFEYYTLYKVKG